MSTVGKKLTSRERLLAAQSGRSEPIRIRIVLIAGARDGEPGRKTIVQFIAPHYGAVIYGNVGAADRLDFTVIGPAVNLVSRTEAVAKSLDLPPVVSDNFSDAHGGPLALSILWAWARQLSDHDRSSPHF